MTSLNKKLRLLFFFSSTIVLILFSTVRSGPFYGKLDFYLLNNKPWWPSWKPMLQYLFKSGMKPVLTDAITSSVLYGVFGQSSIYSRELKRPPRLIIENLDERNRPNFLNFPVGPLALLLSDTSNGETGAAKIMTQYIFAQREAKNNHNVILNNKRPYRCVINMKGFNPSWVPVETGHWRSKIADTKLYYRYQSTHVSDLKNKLKRHPLNNCQVFF